MSTTDTDRRHASPFYCIPVSAPISADAAHGISQGDAEKKVLLLTLQYVTAVLTIQWRDPAAQRAHLDRTRQILEHIPGDLLAAAEKLGDVVAAVVLREAAERYDALPHDERPYFPKIHSDWLRSEASRLESEAHA